MGCLMYIQEILQLYFKSEDMPGMVAHASNSSYSRGGNQEYHGSRPA
jgi:hypothetical protein